jgi:hypothetical protein
MATFPEGDASSDGDGRIPFGEEPAVAPCTQRSRDARQRWAVRRNSFGVKARGKVFCEPFRLRATAHAKQPTFSRRVTEVIGLPRPGGPGGSVCRE